VDVPKVAPPQAVDQLQQVLDSPEVARLILNVEFWQWTGRPGYPRRAMVGMCLVKSIYNLPTWSRTCRLVAEHEGLQRVLGCAPSQWACYRFAKALRTRYAFVLDQTITDVLAGLRERHPNLGHDVAIDASNMPAYANGHVGKHDGTDRTPSDPHASWGHRTAISTRPSGGFFGYKLHAAVDVSTDLPIAWEVASANSWEAHHAIPLLNKAKRRGFDVKVAIMDKGYDNNEVHALSMLKGVSPVIPLRESSKTGREEPPHCAHGGWTFAGADFKRGATKWRCPTGECKPGSMWRKANRLHPLIPRETKRYKQLYRQRSSVEREFGRLKHEWSLLPLRVRGVDRVQLHADLTILARLSCALNRVRTQTLPLAA
jgi:Transposase DDE domain/Transposase domain (DUF772)